MMPEDRQRDIVSHFFFLTQIFCAWNDDARKAPIGLQTMIVPDPRPLVTYLTTPVVTFTRMVSSDMPVVCSIYRWILSRMVWITDLISCGVPERTVTSNARIRPFIWLSLFSLLTPVMRTFFIPFTA